MLNKTNVATLENQVGESSLILGNTSIIGTYRNYQKSELNYLIVYVKGLRYTFEDVNTGKLLILNTLTAPLRGSLEKISFKGEVCYVYKSEGIQLLRLKDTQYVCLSKEGEEIALSREFVGMNRSIANKAERMEKKFQNTPAFYASDAAKLNVINQLQGMQLEENIKSNKLFMESFFKDMERQIINLVTEAERYLKGSGAKVTFHKHEDEFEIRIFYPSYTRYEIEMQSLKISLEENESGVLEKKITEIEKKRNIEKITIINEIKHSFYSQHRLFYTGREATIIQEFFNKNLK